jgi:hypothetical protein
MSVDTWEVSNSEISTYRQCKRKWWLGYFQRLATKKSSVVGPLPLGSRIHKALEMYYTDEMDLLEAHRALVEEDRIGLLLDGYDTSDLDDEAELGRIMLEGYLEWVATEGLDADLRVLGVEEILKYPMLQGAVTLIGKLDLRILKVTDNMRLVLDFKTAASFNIHNDTAFLNTQLKTYQVLDMLTNDPSQRVEGGLYRLLKKVKRTAKAAPPFYQEMTVRHNIYGLRSFWMQLQGVLSDMLATRNALLAGGDHQVLAYPNPTTECRWKCQFFAICPMFDDGSDVDSVIADDYQEVNPYAYYEKDAT